MRQPTLRIALLSEKIKERLHSEFYSLKENQQFLYGIFTSFPIPLLATSPDGKILFVNKAWSELTGYTFKQIEGNTPEFLKSGKTPKKVYAKLWSALKKGNTFKTSEIVNRKKDGTEYNAFSTFTPIVIDGKTTFYLQTQHDITERVRLRKVLEYHDQIMEHIGEAIFIISTTDRTILYSNLQGEKMFGYKKGELVGKHIADLNYGKNKLERQKVTAEVARRLRKEDIVRREVWSRKKNGESFWTHATITPFEHPDFGKVFISIRRDITEIKKNEDIRKEFLSAAAHELKTPITVLKLLSQVHLKKVEDRVSEKVAKKDLVLIDSELNRLTRLIDDILDTSRLETGKWNMDFSEMNLKVIVEKMIHKMKLFGRTHEIVLQKLPDAWVICDLQRVEQVLFNLLSNSIKYSEPDSSITVGMVLKKRHVVVYVRDKGVGIPEKKQSMIFDKYFQVVTEKSSGFGLGLYISKEIITRHKGKIWVQSKVGRGSTFYFSLPLLIKT